MSRTRRKSQRWNRKTGRLEIREVGDAQVDKYLARDKKMKPYQKNPGEWKYKPDKPDGGVGKITAHEKLITKNANRSRKKAYRQKLKKELKDELQSLS